MSIEPAINIPFHRQPAWLDPRAVTSRASTGMGVNRMGRPYTLPANALRPRFHPITGVGEGFFSERQTTNLLLQSEAFNTTWSASVITVTANSTVAPDGATTADTLAATAGGGSVSQAFTITAGRGVSFSVWAKANASNFLYAKVGDGTNFVECWWNLSTGATGTNSAGVSTVLFSQKFIEAYPNGWYRCMLDVTTSVSTSITATIGPAAADNTSPANTNSIFAWGAQAEAETTGAMCATSYIPTTTVTVTRSADMCYLPVDSRWFNPSEGTIVLEFVNRQAPATSSGSHVFGGVANTFTDVMYLARVGTSTVRLTWGNGSGHLGNLDRPYVFTPGTVTKMAFSWALNDVAFAIDGAAPASASSTWVAPTFARIGIGCAPWATSDAGNKPNAIVRAMKYFPRRLANAHLQTLTAAG